MKDIYIETSNEELLNTPTVDVDLRVRHIKSLIATVSKVNVFSNDQNDEFVITRETNEKQGIFKCWSVPIIPFLELNRFDSLSKAMEQTGDFWGRFSDKDVDDVKDWAKRLSEKPPKLWQTLERWRGFCQTQDRRLCSIFNSRELPQDNDERVAELYLRLFTAFGFAAPFYNIEAIVGGSNDISNPIKRDAETTKGGALDLVAIALPSALENKVKCSTLNWGDLDWNKIHEASLMNPSDPESVTAFKVSNILGVPIEDVVFAANVLQYIPTSVGGKRGDLPAKDAREVIDTVLTSRKLSKSDTVGRDTNALIRFMNWLPLIKDNNNFQGSGWVYASVCDTTDLLFKSFHVAKPLLEDFQNIYESELSQQLANLDASSARGRFLIQLLNERKLKPEIYELIISKSTSFFEEISREMIKLETNEQVVDVLDINPRFMVGGKAAGLAEASQIFGRESISNGRVITTEAIGNWLKSDDVIWNLVTDIDNTNDIQEKLKLGRKLSELIKNKAFSLPRLDPALENCDLFAVRSSSFDEDTDFNGTAAGIYESEISVNRMDLGTAISNVVSSFYSEKAISYRNMQNLSDKPMFAIIISPFIEGVGGVAFSSGNNNGWEVVISEDPTNVANNKHVDFDTYTMNNGICNKVINKGLVEEDVALQIGHMVSKAEEILGHRVDMEFIVDKNGKLWVLQLREIRENNPVSNNETFHKLTNFNLENLDQLLKGNSGGLILNDDTRIILGENINIDQFQGILFRWLTINRNSVREIVLSKKIAQTSHFANICINLGIKLVFAKNE